jgi:hypothetical protein
MGLAKSLRGYEAESVYEAVKQIEDQFHHEKLRLSQEISRLEREINQGEISAKIIEPYDYHNNFSQVISTLRTCFLGLNRKKVLDYLRKLIDLRRNELVLLHKHIEFLQGQQQIYSYRSNSIRYFENPRIVVDMKCEERKEEKLDSWKQLEVINSAPRPALEVEREIVVNTVVPPIAQNTLEKKSLSDRPSQSKSKTEIRNQYILGKLAGEDLFDNEGNKIISSHATITEEIIERAEREGKLANLIVSMIIPELVDK